MIFLAIGGYILLALGIVFLSDKLSYYVDQLDKKTTISGAFLGGVLLAAVTSLPELFTSLSATIFIHERELVVGNILGSNLFNLLIIGLAILIFFKNYKTNKIEFKTHFIVFGGLAIIYGLMTYGLLALDKYQPAVGPINFICVLILIVYGLTVFFQPKEKEDNSEDEDKKEQDVCSLSVKQIIVRFIIFALLLISVSILITYVTDYIGDYFALSSTVGGAIFLAVATSLPELVSTLSLCKRGNFNAGLGDIIGSCLFNFCIIGLSEFMSYDGSLLIRNNKEAIIMNFATIIILVFLFFSLLIRYSFDKKKLDKSTKTPLWQNIFHIVTGVVLIAGYFVFLILSMV